jgi:hypothetical protein
MKEAKPVLRAVDKHLDKGHQKKSKAHKVALDILISNSARKLKNIKEGIDKFKQSNDAKVKTCTHELNSWVLELEARIETGKRIYTSAISPDESSGAL